MFDLIVVLRAVNTWRIGRVVIYRYEFVVFVYRKSSACANKCHQLITYNIMVAIMNTTHTWNSYYVYYCCYDGHDDGIVPIYYISVATTMNSRMATMMITCRYRGTRGKVTSHMQSTLGVRMKIGKTNVIPPHTMKNMPQTTIPLRRLRPLRFGMQLNGTPRASPRSLACLTARVVEIDHVQLSQAMCLKKRTERQQQAASRTIDKKVLGACTHVFESWKTIVNIIGRFSRRSGWRVV